MVVYEQRLGRDFDWALQEGSMHFEGESAVHKTLRGIARRLDELGIPYAVAGGMALFFHGYRRFTEDVDILVTCEGLREIHEKLEGLRYLPPYSGGKSLRDVESGVLIKFLVTGDYPGDGKPKPVAFPDPADAQVERDGIRFIPLEMLIELKLASGMTNPHRLLDLADVQALLEELQLPPDFSEQLNPSVREKYQDLCGLMHSDAGSNRVHNPSGISHRT